ncbi:DUF222 domain-containing protein [Prauserella oleivorans]|uniref:DUF222 domain-containing protein n=1 Tax=Prauserella oleivorans TaxID=1478153 RepID=A0ABW5W3T1_9PSEU
MGESFIERLVELEREIARLQALQVRALAEYSASRDDAADVASEVALGLAISENAARVKIGLARDLVSRLPETLGALSRGEIDLYKASKISEPTAVLSDSRAREVDALVSGRLVGRDASSIRRMVNRAVQKVDPEGAAARAEARRRERRVELRHADDAMATLTADLPAEVASAAYARIDRCARALRNAGDGRTMDQLRADVFADLLLSDHPGGGSPEAEIFIHIDLASLVGLSTNPAELAGHGPLPAPIARAIAFDPNSTWRRIITDPHTGAPLDVGRERYRPPAVTADHVKVRDRECRFPTCHRPAHDSDLDHVVPYQRGGDTNTANLIGLCRRHHRTKHTPGWRFHLTDTGALRITTPTGHTYRTR